MMQKKYTMIKEVREDEIDNIVTERLEALLLQNDAYMELLERIRKLYEMNPKVKTVMEFGEAVSLDMHDAEVISEVRNLEIKLKIIEQNLLCLETQRIVVNLFLGNNN